MKKSSKSKAKWEKFEDSTHKVIQTLNPNSKVVKNVFIEGKLSKVPRQIDVQVIKPEQYDFIAFECKDYSRPLDVPIVEAFATKIKDIQARKGAIVSNSPYSKAAQNMASSLDIDLLNLVDTSNKNINGKLYAGMLISDTMLKGFRLNLSFSAPTTGTFRQEPKQLILVDVDGKRGTAYEIFASLWNDDESPLSRITGSYEYIPYNQHFKMVSIEGEEIPLDRLSFIYDVVERHYLSKIEIIDAQGLYNVNEGSFQTKSITTQMIEAYKYETQENEIPVDQVKNLQGQYTFGLKVTSVMPNK